MSKLVPELEDNFFEEASENRGFFFLVSSFMHSLIKITGVFALASAIFAGSFVTYDFLRTRKTFPPKTYIGNIEVTFLNQDEAVKKLKSFPLSKIFAPLITLEADAQFFSFSPEDLGLYLDYNETIKNAFSQTHQPNYFVELEERLITGVEIAPLMLGVDEKKLSGVLEDLSYKIRTTPKDASILFYEDSGGYHIEPEDLGRAVDIKKSIDQFKSYLYQSKTIIPLFIEYEYPRVREEALRAHPPVYRLSAYTTYYGKHDSPNRIHNIKLVASWIDDTLLMPGDVFSVAGTLGEVTKERGFKEAFVIVGGELVPLLGGGSCQIATTLYNSVALADLKVLQRRNHSFYFNIYPLGRDAGVYPGQLDFKFENDTPYPILIKSVATNRRLSFRIYGTSTGKKVEFSPAAIYSFGKSGHYVPVSLAAVIAWDIPFKTVTVRTVYDKDGNKIKEETIESFYKLYGEKSNVPIRRPEPR